MIAVVVFAVGALLLWLLSSRRQWRILLVLILALAPFAWWVNRSVDQYRGWPTTERPPKGCEFVGARVNEPVSIELQCVTSRGSRLFRLPYSTEAHKGVEAAKAAAKSGLRVGVRRSKRGPVRFYVLPPRMPDSTK